MVKTCVVSMEVVYLCVVSEALVHHCILCRSDSVVFLKDWSISVVSKELFRLSGASRLFQICGFPRGEVQLCCVP